MFKLIAIVCLAVASVSAKPGLLASPLVAAAPAIVTAHSSQVVARNYNGLAAPLVAAAPVVAAHAAPLVAAHSAPLVAAGVAPLAYSSPFLPYSSPFLPYSAYSAYAAAAPALYVR